MSVVDKGSDSFCTAEHAEIAEKNKESSANSAHLSWADKYRVLGGKTPTTLDAETT